jgi:hypothetical protein
MPPTPVAFDGVWAKMKWAHQNLQDLERRAFEISRGNHQFVETKEDADAGQRVHYLLRDPIVPIGFMLLTGTVLQSLRSALDHLAYALCVAGPGGRSEAEKNMLQIHFPTTKGDAQAYKAMEARRVVISLSNPGVEKALDAIQPYKGGAGTLLSYLGTLNNIDKHRLLLTVTIQTPLRDMRPNAETFDPQAASLMRQGDRAIRAVGIFGMGPPIGVPLKAGDVVFRERLNSKTDEKVNFAFPIAINEPEVLPIQSVVELLYDMKDLISRIIPAFNAFV